VEESQLEQGGARYEPKDRTLGGRGYRASKEPFGSGDRTLIDVGENMARLLGLLQNEQRVEKR